MGVENPDQNHLHLLRDSDHHFTIDPITRAITNANSKKTILMQHDHNSEVFTFEIDKTVEGHDMTECTKIEVHYANDDANKKNQSIGVYEVPHTYVNNETNKLEFEWFISENATMYAGSLRFLIVFTCIEDGKVAYRWNTGINSSISIAKGMNNGEAIEKSYPDILEQWKDALFASVYGVKTIHVGPTEPEEYPYIWFDTSNYTNGNDKNVGVITIKDADGTMQTLYPFTHLRATDAANIEDEMNKIRGVMDGLSKNDGEHAQAIDSLQQKDESLDKDIATLNQDLDALEEGTIRAVGELATDIQSTNTALNKAVTDLTAKDNEIRALAASKSSTANETVMLPTTGWEGEGPYTQAIAVNGALADEANCDVIIGYKPSHKYDFVYHSVDIIEQRDKALVFTVDIKPETEFPVSVLFIYRGGDA